MLLTVTYNFECWIRLVNIKSGDDNFDVLALQGLNRVFNSLDLHAIQQIDDHRIHHQHQTLITLLHLNSTLAKMLLSQSGRL